MLLGLQTKTKQTRNQYHLMKSLNISFLCSGRRGKHLSNKAIRSLLFFFFCHVVMSHQVSYFGTWSYLVDNFNGPPQEHLGSMKLCYSQGSSGQQQKGMRPPASWSGGHEPVGDTTKRWHHWGWSLRGTMKFPQF